MLSYEKGCEVLMMKVRQQLITAGFNVRLGGGDNLHEVMRKDVEGAAAVVVAFTRKYKQEPQTFAGNFTSAKTGFVLYFHLSHRPQYKSVRIVGLGKPVLEKDLHLGDPSLMIRVVFVFFFKEFERNILLSVSYAKR